MSALPGPRPGDGLLGHERRSRGVLDTIRRTSFRASTNLKGETAGANWWFALPSLEANATLSVGRVSAATLATLEGMSRDVTTSQADRRGRLPAADHSVDVVFVRGRRRAARLAPELARVAKRDAVVVVDELHWRGRPNRHEPSQDGQLLFRLMPAAGEAKALAPIEDRAACAFVAAKVPARVHVTRRNLGRTVPLLARAPVAALLTQRVARFVGAPSGPPKYVRAIARASGVDVEGRRWALAAPGDYASQKVVLFLFDDAGRPEYVVKLTRAPEWNTRLENEWRALEVLEEVEFGGTTARPRPAFRGMEGGLAVVGETAIHGDRFTARTTGGADCPYALAVLDRLVELAATTADATAADPAMVAAALDDLLDRFVAVYRSPEAEEAFLRAQIDVVRASTQPFPVVLQHGDPGPWNVLVTGPGDVGFLDWEAAEPNGLPLWDVFYFLRCYGVAVSRAAGRDDSTASFAEHFLGDTPFARLLAGTTARVCERVGLDRPLVEPLFYTCWMHRALKEATRKRPERLQRARFLRLLRLAIEERGAPGLGRLFSA